MSSPEQHDSSVYELDQGYRKLRLEGVTMDWFISQQTNDPSLSGAEILTLMRGQFKKEVDAIIACCNPRLDDFIVDIGCNGAGHIKQFLEKGFSNIIGMDFSTDWLSIGKEEHDLKSTSPINLIKGDWDNLPFKDQSFDLVYTLFTLADNPENTPLEILQGLATILKPKGKLVIEFLDDQKIKNSFERKKANLGQTDTLSYTFQQESREITHMSTTSFHLPTMRETLREEWVEDGQKKAVEIMRKVPIAEDFTKKFGSAGFQLDQIYRDVIITRSPQDFTDVRSFMVMQKNNV